MNVLVLEPWLGGSHEAFLGSWREHSRHSLDVRGQTPHHWRWRMASSAWVLGSELAEAPRPDLVFASAYLDASRWRAFAPSSWGAVPLVTYFHENQLTYPEAPGEGGRSGAPPDLDYAFANVLTAIASDGVAFNSEFHRAEFAAAADEWLARMPRPAPRAALARSLERARVFSPGPSFQQLEAGPGPEAGAPLTLAFPHRLEHDKDPRAFLEAVREARSRGAELALVMLGQRFRAAPAGVDELLEELAPVIRWSGHATREEYLHQLSTSDLVVSTARHEFFGIATVEALALGCSPLLPARLAYPELLSGWRAPGCGTGLYATGEALVERLVELARDPSVVRGPSERERNRTAAARYDARRWAPLLDDWLEEHCPDPIAPGPVG